MSPRNAQYREWDVVFLLDGVSDALAARIDAGLVELLGHPIGAPLRRAWPAPGRPLGVREAQRRARAAVRRIEQAGSDASLVAAARHAGYPAGLPVSVTVCGDRLAVAFAHAVADGGGMVVLLQALLRAALGEPLAEAPQPATRFPLLRALVAAGPRALLAARPVLTELDVPPVPAEAPDPQQAALDRARLLRVRLDAERLGRIRRARRGGGRGRATISTRVVSLALTALRETSRRTEDVRVALPVDLRHLVQGRVDGNFVSTAPMGGLRSTDWTPARISERVAALSGPAGLVALASGTTRAVRARITRAAPWRERAVSVSVLTSDVLPAGTWRAPAAAGVACATIGPWPSAVFVLLWFAGEEAYLSVWDEGEVVDLDRFQDEFERELVRREPPAD
jgi:hypothetical protein